MADKKKVKGRWNLYEIAGDSLKRKNKNCPKCGPASVMAKHANRESCGKCEYTEFSGKK